MLIERRLFCLILLIIGGLGEEGLGLGGLGVGGGVVSVLFAFGGFILFGLLYYFFLVFF